MVLVAGGLLALTVESAGATPAVTPAGGLVASGVSAAHKGRIDVDVTVINTLYSYYGESYASADVRAYYRSAHKRIANGRVEVSITFYPKGWRMDEDGDWRVGGTGPNKMTKNVTVELNSKGRALEQLGQSWRYTEIPPLKGARTTSTGAVYSSDGTYLGTDEDSARKKVVQRVIKGE